MADKGGKKVGPGSSPKNRAMARGSSVQAKDRWILYILECRDGSLYTGVTIDMARRLRQHQLGKASRYTRSRLPVLLVYREFCPDRSAALRRELAVKAMSRSAKIAMLGRST